MKKLEKRILLEKYGSAVIWIANNDEPAIMDLDEIESQISVQLVSAIFNVPAHLTAKAVLEEREDSKK